MKKLDCAKYIKKPVVLEAIKFEYDNEVWMVKTIEGWIKMKDWDYIIKGVDGEFYPCKASIFNKTYQKVE